MVVATRLEDLAARRVEELRARHEPKMIGSKSVTRNAFLQNQKGGTAVAVKLMRKIFKKHKRVQQLFWLNVLVKCFKKHKSPSSSSSIIGLLPRRADLPTFKALRSKKCCLGNFLMHAAF